jgi:type I restriction enzyme S subunit
MVEWKSLGEICNVLDNRRKPVSKGNRNKGIYPYYGANGVQDYVDDYIFDGTYLLLGEDGSVINSDKSPVLHWATGKIWVNNHAHILEENDNALLRYVYYSLQCTDVSDIVRGIPPKINQANMRGIQIPLPSRADQERIVGILDTFTSSIDNLKEQIALRRKQYEYYRDQLLDLEGKEGVEMRKLSETCEIRRGIRVVKKQLKDTALYPVFQNSIAPMGYYDQYNRDGNMPYVICAGSSSGSVGYCFTPFWAADDCYTIESSNLNRKYIYYALKKNNNKLFKLVRKGSMPRLPHDAIDNLIIPIPPFVEQQRIVDILDTFEASIQNLEAQLAGREKQYEYYRNKLLTFE